MQVDVVVLSEDLELFQAIRESVGEHNPVWRARSAEESVDLLITGRCGVLLIDLASVTAQPETLVQRLLDQFPDVVVCVAGQREDEPALALMIGEGHIYRFMHKPLSPRRAHMFLQAAMRHHVARREKPQLALVTDNVVSLPSRLEPVKWVLGAIGVALFVLLLSIFLDDGKLATDEAPDAAPAAAAPAHLAPAGPKLANPVLSRARAAFDAGRYESPPGNNALDLYKAVVLSQPGNAEAKTGFDRTVDRVLINARMALDAGNTAEARRLVDRALAADPERRTAVQLAQQIRKAAEPEPLPVPVPVPVPPPVVKAPPAAAPPPVAVVNVPATPVPTPPTSSTKLATPVAAVPVLPAPVSSKPLPGPVTRLPPLGTTPVVTAPKVAPAPVVIRPDPLAARVVNSSEQAGRPRERIYARKVESLPIAGYVSSRAPEPAGTVVDHAEAAPEASQPSGTVLPADSFEKLVVTDPVYPREALRTRTQGWVQLEFTITPSGAVRDIAVIEGQPQGVFERSAADALAKWRFKPRYVNGQPTSQRSTLIMHFDLEG